MGSSSASLGTHRALKGGETPPIPLGSSGEATDTPTVALRCGLGSEELVLGVQAQVEDESEFQSALGWE